MFSLSSPALFEHNHGLNMMSLREHIYGVNGFDRHAALDQNLKITHQGSGVAGDVQQFFSGEIAGQLGQGVFDHLQID